MSKQCTIDKKCLGCDWNFSTLGCVNHDCPTWIEYTRGREEMYADEEMDKKRENKNEKPMDETY